MESFTNKIFYTDHSKGVDLYIIDIATLKAVKINQQPLNVTLVVELPVDDQTILYRIATKPASAIRLNH
ncbi:hypothetical protein CS542_09595 [Pedobacter sp. IW39]|nr:hypothetical protein CS542_09595 [Pedobacter sp. IW39]